MVPDPHAITPRVFDLLVLLDSPMFILDLYDQIKATTPGGTFHLDLLPRIDDWQSFRSSSKECTYVCLIHHLFSAEKLNGHRVEYKLPKFLCWNQRHGASSETWQCLPSVGAIHFPGNVSTRVKPSVE